MNNSILENIQSMPVIDVHEHLICDNLRIQKYPDYISLLFSNYVYGNAVSAGMTWGEYEYILNPNGDLEKKYTLFKRILPYIRFTSVYRCINRAFRDLYDISLDETDFEKNNTVYIKNNVQGATCRLIEKDTKVKWIINDVYDISMQNTVYQMDNKYMIPTVRCDKYILFDQNWDLIEKEWNCSINSLNTMASLLEKYIRQVITEYHGVALKLAVAYDRSLQFENIAFSEAESAFENILKSRLKGEGISLNDVGKVQDYLVHQIMELAESLDVPIQIHTGFQDRNQNDPRRSDPRHLIPLFIQHPKVKFVLFHTGFPDGRHAGVLAKMFPNVFVDFSWVHVLSESYAQTMLREYIELIPCNKFSVFGGDFFHREGFYGHLQIALENLAEVMRDLLKDNVLNEKEMDFICKRLLFYNPKELYKLS